MRKVALMAVALAVAGTTACKTVGRQMLKEPTFTLSDVRLVGAGMTGGALDIKLKVYNPNDFRLDGSRIRYRVFIDSTSVGGGSLEQRFTVANGDTTELTLPMTFTYAGLGAAARQLQSQGTVNYRVTGDIEVATPIGNFTRPFDQSGRYTVFRD